MTTGTSIARLAQLRTALDTAQVAIVNALAPGGTDNTLNTTVATAAAAALRDLPAVADACALATLSPTSANRGPVARSRSAFVSTWTPAFATTWLSNVVDALERRPWPLQLAEAGNGPHTLLVATLHAFAHAILQICDSPHVAIPFATEAGLSAAANAIRIVLLLDVSHPTLAIPPRARFATLFLQRTLADVAIRIVVLALDHTPAQATRATIFNAEFVATIANAIPHVGGDLEVQYQVVEFLFRATPELGLLNNNNNASQSQSQRNATDTLRKATALVDKAVLNCLSSIDIARFDESCRNALVQHFNHDHDGIATFPAAFKFGSARILSCSSDALSTLSTDPRTIKVEEDETEQDPARMQVFVTPLVDTPHIWLGVNRCTLSIIGASSTSKEGVSIDVEYDRIAYYDLLKESDNETPLAVRIVVAGTPTKNANDAPKFRILDLTANMHQGPSQENDSEKLSHILSKRGIKSRKEMENKPLTDVGSSEDSLNMGSSPLPRRSSKTKPKTMANKAVKEELLDVVSTPTQSSSLSNNESGSYSGTDYSESSRPSKVSRSLNPILAGRGKFSQPTTKQQKVPVPQKVETNDVVESTDTSSSTQGSTTEDISQEVPQHSELSTSTLNSSESCASKASSDTEDEDLSDSSVTSSISSEDRGRKRKVRSSSRRDTKQLKSKSKTSPSMKHNRCKVTSKEDTSRKVLKRTRSRKELDPVRSGRRVSFAKSVTLGAKLPVDREERREHDSRVVPQRQSRHHDTPTESSFSEHDIIEDTFEESNDDQIPTVFLQNNSAVNTHGRYIGRRSVEVQPKNVNAGKMNNDGYFEDYNGNSKYQQILRRLESPKIAEFERKPELNMPGLSYRLQQDLQQSSVSVGEAVAASLLSRVVVVTNSINSVMQDIDKLGDKFIAYMRQYTGLPSTDQDDEMAMDEGTGLLPMIRDSIDQQLDLVDQCEELTQSIHKFLTGKELKVE